MLASSLPFGGWLSSHGDRAALVRALHARVGACWRPDTAGERLELSTDLVELADAVGERHAAVEARRDRFAAALELGRIDAARADAAAMTVLAAELRQPAELYWAAVADATLALLAGAFPAAATAIARAAEHGSGLEDSSQGQLATGVTAQMLLYHRDVGRLPQQVAGGIETVEGSLAVHLHSNNTLDQTWRAGAADFLLTAGRRAEAQDLFHEIRAKGCDAVPVGPQWMCTLAVAANLCRTFDDAEGADQLSAMLAPHASRYAVVTFGVGCIGSVAHFLGQLAGVLGDWKEADTYFTMALDANRRIGAPPMVARTQLEYARTLLRRRADDEQGRASGLLSAAAATATRLGMAPLLREIEAVRSIT